jgi:hypothetical protein
MKKILLSIGVLFLVGCGVETATSPENSVEPDVAETEEEKKIREITEFGVDEHLFKSGPVMSKRVYTTMTYFFPGTPQIAQRIKPEPVLPGRPISSDSKQKYIDMYKGFFDYIQKKEGAEYTLGLWGYGYSKSEVMFELPIDLPNMKYSRALVTADGANHAEIERLRILAIDDDDNIWHFEDRLTYDDEFMQKVNLKFVWGECEGALGISWKALGDCTQEKNLSPNSILGFENEEEIVQHLKGRLHRFVRKIEFN